MQRELLRGVSHNEALLNNSSAFNEQMAGHCARAVQDRDTRVLKMCEATSRAAALAALRQLGAIVPPWLDLRDERAAMEEFRATLMDTLASREYELRSRIVRTVTAASYEKTRLTPKQCALPKLVGHVMGSADVARLRAGECLVLDPEPALLTRSQMAAAHADLMRLVNAGGAVVESQNPCNKGSYHGMLPIDPARGEEMGLTEATRVLIRQLAALPAIVEAAGWPRR